MSVCIENIHRNDEMTPQGLEAHAIILEILILAQYVFIISFNIYMVDASYCKFKIKQSLVSIVTYS